MTSRSKKIGLCVIPAKDIWPSGVLISRSVLHCSAVLAAIHDRSLGRVLTPPTRNVKVEPLSTEAKGEWDSEEVPTLGRTATFLSSSTQRRPSLISTRA